MMDDEYDFFSPLLIDYEEKFFPNFTSGKHQPPQVDFSTRRDDEIHTSSFAASMPALMGILF